MAGARFGRNVPIADTFGERPPDLYEPNPRVVSRELLARRNFVPVPHLNIMVAAWLQFMVHDWLSHGGGDLDKEPHSLPLPPGDDWPAADVSILHTSPDDLRGPADQGQPATYRNNETHWWDGSQIYGSDPDGQRAVRTDPATGQVRADGKLQLDDAAICRSIAGPTTTIPDLELAGGERQLVDRPLRHAHAVRARAQRDRRPAAHRLSRRPTANGCSRRRGWSMPRSSPRSTPSNGRRR